MKLLVTGAAGFIGYHLTKRLAKENHTISCIDNINDYYDVDLKYGRLASLGFSSDTLKSQQTDGFISSSRFPLLRFSKMDLCNAGHVTKLFENSGFDIVLHMAAQAGVRYSLVNPHSYISSNVLGFLNLLESLRLNPSCRLVYASSSSVYGLNSKSPFTEHDPVNKPASLYAVTKRTNELMAYTYSNMYHIPSTGLRFFTVYGPWGRPDMAPFIFTKSIIDGQPINVYNSGNMKRDFTYIDDIIEGIIRVMNKVPQGNSEDRTPIALYNIGNGEPVPLMDFIHTLEETLGKKAIIQYASMQPGDVAETWADCSALAHDTSFCPNTPLSTGIGKFVDWYKSFYC